MITVNGREVAHLPANLAELVTAEGIDPRARGIALAVNDSVIPRSRWEATSLSPGDRVEIVKVLQGG